MDSRHIRNFSIIAHIDHGKSTLADRMLEITGTIEKRKMMDQVLDKMELERERGITIKMQPVRMLYKKDATEYTLHLIDTPGHIDFSYEVSRAIKAVEGSILLVDATQGVQAQTLTTLAIAREQGLTIIPVISKIDSALARIDDTKHELAVLLGCTEEEILMVSGREGTGVRELLDAVIERIPPPKDEQENGLKSLVFDFQYSNHRGVIVYIRLFSGSVRKGDQLLFKVAGETFQALEVGTFTPAETPRDELRAGDIGYIVTGIKRPGVASVGDTITSAKNPLPEFPGYERPRPVVFASIYPENQDDFPTLRLALDRLRLSDSSFTHEEEASGTLGRGYRCGFLGMLHLEIITERLHREFSLTLIVTLPSINYTITKKGGETEVIYTPYRFPDDGSITRVQEPWVRATIISPNTYLGPIMQLLYEHEAEVGETETFGDDRARVVLLMPLRELMRNFFDELKSVSSGYASLSYEITDLRDADVVRLDILVGEEIVPAFTRIISRRRIEEESETMVEKLFELLPRRQFVTKIQARALGRIVSSKSLSAFRKDVTQHMYGGDITRRMKLLEKQKKGKKKMQENARFSIPHDVFLKMMRGGKE